MSGPPRGSSIMNLVANGSRAPPQVSQMVSSADTELIRAEYLYHIVKPDWDEAFYQMLTAHAGNTTTDLGSIRVTINSQTRDVTLPFYIGRQSLPRQPDTGARRMDHIETGNQTSRCHALVTKVNDSELLVIDPGSLTGIRTIKRSGGIPEHSLPSARKALKFGGNERFVLRLGVAVVGFNLDRTDGAESSESECIVCMVNPAIDRLQCGHCVVCASCRARLATCPMCRATIRSAQLTVFPDLQYRP